MDDPLLIELVDEALAGNLTLEAARSRLRQARLEEIVAGSGAAPRVEASAQATRTKISRNAPLVGQLSRALGGDDGHPPALPGSEFSTYRVGFDTAWEMDLFGRTRRQVEGARARTQAQAWSEADLRLAVAAEVIRQYAELRSAQARALNTQDDVARAARLARLTEVQRQTGYVSQLEVAEEDARLAQVRSGLPELLAQEQAHMHALAVLTGKSPDALAARLRDARPTPRPPAPPANLSSEVVRRRPDIQAAERRLAAATADEGVAVADLYPRFQLTANGSFLSTTLRNLLSARSFGGDAAAGLAWPVFDGGRLRAAAKEAGERRREAYALYQETVLQALRETADALDRYDAAHVRELEVGRALTSAERSLRLQEVRHTTGYVSELEVLRAREATIRLRDERSRAQAELAMAYAGAIKALGGPWEP